MRYTVDVKNLVNEVQVNYLSGLTDSRAAKNASVPKGRPQIISNDSIDLNSIAHGMATKLVGEYSIDRTFLEIDNIWLPSLEIGQYIDIWDTNTYQTSVVYEIYRIREDIVNCKTKLYCISDVLVGKKFGVCSTSDHAVCGTVFTDSWHSGFAFVCAVNTGFDDDGNNNDVINTAYVASGAGTTGIELPFVVD